MPRKMGDPISNRVAYEISEVRLFQFTVHISYAIQGKPYCVSTAPKYYDETSKLLLAIQSGQNFGHSHKLVQKSFKKVAQREERRRTRLQLLDNVTHYAKVKNGITSLICCRKRMCMDAFSCGMINSDEEAIKIFQWIRMGFQKMC